MGDVGTWWGWGTWWECGGDEGRGDGGCGGDGGHGGDMATLRDIGTLGMWGDMGTWRDMVGTGAQRDVGVMGHDGDGKPWIDMRDMVETWWDTGGHRDLVVMGGRGDTGYGRDREGFLGVTPWGREGPSPPSRPHHVSPPGLADAVDAEPGDAGGGAHGGLGVQHAAPLGRHRELPHRARGVQAEGVLQVHGREPAGPGRDHRRTQASGAGGQGSWEPRCPGPRR